MKKSFIVFPIIFVLFIASCSNPASNDYKTMSGNWQTRNTTTYTSNSSVFILGGITTATFSLTDNGNSIAMDNFGISGSTFITWYSVTGTYSGNTFAGNVSGYYYNTSNQLVTVTLAFTALIDDEKESGNGTFSETLSVNSSSVTCSGTIVISRI